MHLESSSEDFTFNRTMRIRFVDEDEVDVTEVEVLKRFFDGLDDFLAVEATCFATAATMFLKENRILENNLF